MLYFLFVKTIERCSVLNGSFRNDVHIQDVIQLFPKYSREMQRDKRPLPGTLESIYYKYSLGLNELLDKSC